MAKIPKPIIVTRATMTSFACPSQWEGMTECGRRIYVRYRWEHLSVRVGKPGDMRDNAAICGVDVFEADGDWLMSYAELKQVTSGVIQWPDKETPYEVKKEIATNG